MAFEVQRFIMYSSSVPVAIASIVGVLRYRQLGRTLRYLVMLTLFALLITAVSFTLMHYKRPNLFLAPVDTAIEFTLLCLMYGRTLQPMALTRYIPVGIAAFLLGSAFSYSPQTDTVEFSPIQHFIESVAVLAFVLLFFRREIMRRDVKMALEREPMFWVLTGLLLYFSGNILIFLSSNAVLHYSKAMSLNVWMVHAILYIFLNVFFIIALCVRPRPVVSIL